MIIYGLKGWTMLNELRCRVFWSLDKVRGGVVLENYNSIKSFLENPDNEEFQRHRDTLLSDLIAHSKATVPFYKNYKSSRLIDLPVVNKKMIMENFEAFKSDIHTGKDMYKVQTSGSTGVPLELYQNIEKRNRNRSDVLYFLSETGYQIGNLLIELEVWRVHNKKPKAIQCLQNKVQFDVSKLTEARITQLLKYISTHRGPKNLLGFASAFETICQYMDEQNIMMTNCGINGIIVNSEFLNDYTRSTLIKRFNTPVFSRYSNEELGILAHQTFGSEGRFKLNWASYFFEILNMDADKPVENGEMGRIVVTDLFNYAMPLLRYDTGDIGMFDPIDADKLFLKSVEGRKMDIVYDTEGNIVSSHVIYTLFYPYYELIKQYQFIQTGSNEYVIKLNLKDSFPNEIEMTEAVKKEFGRNAAVKFEYVEDIPTLSSGKRRKVVNLYK